MIQPLNPFDKESSRYSAYNKNDLIKYIESQINYETQNIKGKKIFIQGNTISQSKLRDAGFKIKRSAEDADLIVISSIESMISEKAGIRYGLNEFIFYNKYYCTNDNEFISSKRNYEYEDTGLEKINEILGMFDPKYKYISDKTIYNYLYKYDGTLELFNSISDMLKTKDPGNVQIGMEMMTNANWTNNEIYLYELFNLYWKNTITLNSYKNSISFKGLLLNIPSVYLTNQINILKYPKDYIPLCITDEHHKFVFDKYYNEFTDELDDIKDRYKIKFDKLEYSINKD